MPISREAKRSGPLSVFFLADLPTPAVASAVRRASRAWIGPTETTVFLCKKENVAKSLKYMMLIRQFLSFARPFSSLNRQKTVAILAV